MEIIIAITTITIILLIVLLLWALCLAKKYIMKLVNMIYELKMKSAKKITIKKEIHINDFIVFQNCVKKVKKVKYNNGFSEIYLK